MAFYDDTMIRNKNFQDKIYDSTRKLNFSSSRSTCYLSYLSLPPTLTCKVFKVSNICKLSLRKKWNDEKYNDLPSI